MAIYSVSKNSVDLAVDPLISCSVCLGEFSRDDMYELESCSCLYCKSCMKQYLTIMINEGNVISITCPDALCRRGGHITRAEIQHMTDTSLYDKYVRLRFQKEVELDPGRTWCPEAGCETVCHVCPPTASAEPALTAKPVQCPTCSLMFCLMCKAKWHDGKTCDDFFNTEPNGIPFNSSEDAEIKRCPLCFVPIERADGCAQMMCKRCKHVFCWYCLAPLDDDFLLRHYDKGPCKNKLGHSRASVIWHRTQVVGIFAGFGVLLLVVSPLLLLAAPCILCCKCAKSSKCCNPDPADDALSS